MKTIGIDIETYSSVDLGKCGVYKYAESPDFEILLFGYAVDDGEVNVIDLAGGEAIPDEILAALTDESVEKWCLSRYLSDLGVSRERFLPPEGWRCSMVWAATLGLPLSLEGVGAVLGLEKQKLTEGKDLIKYFCTPCAPTKANGGRTRNLPFHAHDKWAQFKAYNLRDVEVEITIRQRLSKFPVSSAIWEEYRIDQEINDRGIEVDMDLVEQALRMDALSREKLTAAMKHMTEMENPNSVQQMKDWLSQNGMDVDSLGKKEVAALMQTCPPELRKVLVLRQQLAKSSVRKYTAMRNAVCADRRARGMFRFYGANRTGRFSGKLIQLQNLPQNHLPDLEEARALVKCGDMDALEMLYEDIPDTLSQLIRAAFIPRKGSRFIVADFSAIEARVIAWLAGENWKSEAFARGDDIYCSTASRMFKVPVVKHGINGELRQKGKITELACIAEGELVLTDQGLVPIEKVTTGMKLWDGQSWVSHDGVIYKGEREVITYEGLTATPDHLVWVEGQPEPIYFGVAAACGARLLQTGNGRREIRMGNHYQSGKKMESKAKSLLCTDPLQWLWSRAMAGATKFDFRQIKRLPALLTTKANSSMAGETTHCGKAAVRKSQRPCLFELRCQGNPVCISEHYRSRSVFTKNFRTSGQEFADRPDKRQWRLCAGEYQICFPAGEHGQQTDHGSEPVRTAILALLPERSNEKIILGNEPGGYHSGCGKSRVGEKKKLAYHQRTARLYDIRNAGRHHRFTVSGRLVHNCGYGGSVGALKAMGALEMGLDESELQPLVTAWRESNSNIVQLWWEVDRCVKSAVKHHIDSDLPGLKFSCRSGMLFITLPSGRKLAYVKPRIGENRFGGECVTYEGVGGVKKWERLESYGPKFVENIVQGISRDILCCAMQTLRNCRIVAHVHDELIIEAEEGMSLDVICEQIAKTPPWAKGLLLRADGFTSDFYRKD